VTKQQLEQKIRTLTEQFLSGHLSMKEAFSQQSLLLADYFADTSCQPEPAFIEQLKAISDYCSKKFDQMNADTVEAQRYRIAANETFKAWKYLSGEHDTIIRNSLLDSKRNIAAFEQRNARLTLVAITNSFLSSSGHSRKGSDT
jgi:hypothetical protein